MTSQKFAARDILGLTPAVDPVVSESIFALGGRNYVFDSRGPKSPFGNRLLTPVSRARPEYMQGFRLKLRSGDRCFDIDADGIWEWNESVGTWLSVYLTPDTSLSPYRWTHGYLNGYMYFAHPRVGILAYNLDTGLCVPHKNIGIATPDEALAIVIDNGRLAVIGTTLFSWSAPSDGLNFTPELGGAGFQRISDRVSGNPIMITSYGRGCLIWTTGGVMRSEFTGDASVYRHRSLNTEYRPINSFCACRVDDDTVVILDERGLFKTRGEAPEPYTPLFNEFLIDYIQQNDLRIGNNLRLEWDELQRRMYVSYSLSYADPIFESCFVLYPPLDKWGQFNEPHYGIFPLLIKDSERADDYYGFVDATGRVRYWELTGSRQKTPELCESYKAGNLYIPANQKPVFYDETDDGIVLSSSGKVSTFYRELITRTSDYYAVGVTTPMIPELVGLDAKIQFGLFRPTGPTAPDEASEITNVVIRSVISGEQTQVAVDYNLIPDSTADEDYNAAVGVDNYGFENLNYVNHKLKLVGTLDGETEFVSAIPSMVEFKKGARYYSGGSVGVWHLAEISAEDVGESFHIKSFEISAISAGRIL